jgi:hypothetical protein
MEKMDGKKGEKIFSPNIHLFFYNPFVPKLAIDNIYSNVNIIFMERSFACPEP